MRTESTVPEDRNIDPDEGHLLLQCIGECLVCGQACTTCADACTLVPEIEQLRQCIRVSLDCATLCETAAKLASRSLNTNESIVLATLDVCATACRLCAEECERHAAHHRHCAICAQACRRCQEACTLAMQDIGGASGRVQTN